MRSFMVYTFHRPLIVWYNGGGRDEHGYGSLNGEQKCIHLVTIAD